MPTCPNCGSVLPAGAVMCSCGTTFRRSVPEESQPDPREQRIDTLRDMARELEDEGRYLEAIDCYYEIRSLNPYSLVGRKIGDNYYKAGRYEDALEEYLDCFKGRDSYKVYRSIAMTLSKLKRFDEAIENYHVALDKLNENPDFDCRVVCSDGDDPQLIERLKNDADRRLEAKNRLISEIYNDIGWAYNEKGDYDKAIECFETAIDYDYESSNNWNCKAIALENKGMYVEAVKFFDIAIKFSDDEVLVKNRKECLIEYGRAYANKEYGVGSEYLKEALELFEDDKKRIDSKLQSIGRENLITIAGSYYYGLEDKLTEGVRLVLLKERNNPYDSDAIAVYLGADKVGYVSNSADTNSSFSTRASDFNFGEMAYAEYLMKYDDRYHIARIIW